MRHPTYLYIFMMFVVLVLVACGPDTETQPEPNPIETPAPEPTPEPDAPSQPEVPEPSPDNPPEPAPEPEPAPSTLRLMPLGDSITYGAGSTLNNGYRVMLGDLLLEGEPAALDVDFVGSQDSGRFADPAYVHEGYSGWVIEQLVELVTPTAENAGPLLTYNPNLITLHIGTNDMNQNREVESAPERLETLIDRIFEAVPDVTLVVATLVPAQDPALNARIEMYNQSVRDLVQTRRSQGEKIVLADMSAVTPQDLADNLHPNNAGYERMARVFDTATKKALSLGWLAERPNLPDIGAVTKWLNGVRSVFRR